ncbi:hypothetical protein NM688_g3321 [Phlebia brevispora]|uniref:Uncharacterized protein n=1 Tax=Phlebia brevispora TaxID=194682 RepID=A0ACC1T611_9APHY|nr:hypothetical protein NM688_g3321 [Phlebia brevispora]
MSTMDSNNSLKQLLVHETNNVTDDCIFKESNYYLSYEYVNKFAHEIKSRKETKKEAKNNMKGKVKGKAKMKVKANATMNDDDEEEDLNNMELGAPEEGDPTDSDILDNLVKTCVKNWKSTAAEEKKKIAKYPLTIIAKILELRGHAAQEFVGWEWLRKERKMIINAFHRYSHNYACQMLNYPSCIASMELEDFEIMEQVFSSLNRLAPVIWHTSAYHCHIFIDMYFQQWD